LNLLTQTLLNRFKEVGKQDINDPIIIAKFFAPSTAWTWYATSYDEEAGLFFGIVCGTHIELAYFSIQDLKGMRGPMGLHIERDLYWKEKRLSELSKRQPDLAGFL
jgi:hypothetical protein